MTAPEKPSACGATPRGAGVDRELLALEVEAEADRLERENVYSAQGITRDWLRSVAEGIRKISAASEIAPSAVGMLRHVAATIRQDGWEHHALNLEELAADLDAKLPQHSVPSAIRQNPSLLQEAVDLLENYPTSDVVGSDNWSWLNRAREAIASIRPTPIHGVTAKRWQIDADGYMVTLFFDKLASMNAFLESQRVSAE